MSEPRKADHPIDDVFLSRWSPRAFADEVIPLDTLLTFLEAARWSPSGSNVQPWRFVYGLKGDDGFTAILSSLVPFNQGWAQHASALVVIASASLFTPPGAPAPVPFPTHAFDAGCSWGMLAIQAALSGWHTHAMAGFDAALAATAVSLPADHVIHAVVAIGKLGDPATLSDMLRQREVPSPRRPLTETAFHGAFAAV